MIVQPPINHEATGLFDTVRLFKPCLVGSQFPGPHSMHALSLQHTSCRTKVTPVGLREMSCFGNQTRPGPMAVAACRPSQDTRHLQAQLVLHTCIGGCATVCYGNRGQLIEGSLEVKLPTVWTDKKKRWEDSEKRKEEKRRRKKKEEGRSEKRRVKKKEDAGARKGRKVANHSVFPLICLRKVKSRFAKAAGAGPSGQMRD